MTNYADLGGCYITQPKNQPFPDLHESVLGC